MDGVGEWATTSYGVGLRNNVELSKSINFPHSLVYSIQLLHILPDLKSILENINLWVWLHMETQNMPAQ